MSVEFEDPKYAFERKNYFPQEGKTPVMNLFIKMKLAKTPAQANVWMIGVCIFCITLTIIILVSVL